MAGSGLPIFDKSVQDANIWLNGLMAELDWTEKHRAYRLLRATLHTLRDRLSVDEAADLGAQLPTIMRGIFYEGWNPSAAPRRWRTRKEFVDRIETAFERDPNEDPEAAVRAALRVISAHVTRGEIEDIESALPPDIRELWH